MEVSCCGAATTASTAPSIAAFTAAAQNAIDARPLTGLTTPKPRALASGCGQGSTFTFDASRPHALACRASKSGSHTMTGSQEACTCAFIAALSTISGPIPAGSPTGIAIRSLLILQPRHQRGVDYVRHAFAADRLDRLVDIVQSEPVRRHQL